MKLYYNFSVLIIFTFISFTINANESSKQANLVNMAVESSLSRDRVVVLSIDTNKWLAAFQACKKITENNYQCEQITNAFNFDKEQSRSRIYQGFLWVFHINPDLSDYLINWLHAEDNQETPTQAQTDTGS